MLISGSIDTPMTRESLPAGLETELRTLYESVKKPESWEGVRVLGDFGEPRWLTVGYRDWNPADVQRLVEVFKKYRL